MKKACLLICTVCLLFASMPQAAEKVRAWEGTLTIPTYPWQPDDLNPKFFTLEGSIIYPYTMQDHLSNQKRDRTYKALFLENEYLKVICLPELGGRIHSVLDKSTGREMFHTNKVIKPGLIAMRGAWISGGIEWNTGPHGHTVTAVSPVDALLEENADGSASLVVNNVEKIFRTRWTVVLTLHPGKAYLDETMRMFNPTSGVHPYYFWNCTAFYNLPGTRFIYPMTLGCDHSAETFFTWPVNRGKDITWLKNYDRPSSVFAYDCIFDFFGAYDNGLDQGIVQYANHRSVIGKKAWTWGQSDDGIVSQKNLHDFGEQYIEVQSGPLLTQADYGMLEPRQEIAWQEWWFPVHGLGDGFEYATREAAVQTYRQGKRLEIRVLATGDYPNASCKISQNGDVLRSEAIALSPRAPVVVQVDAPAEGPCDISIQDEGGNILAAFTSPLPIPKVEVPEQPWLRTRRDGDLTTEEKFLKGVNFDKQTDRPAAREWYERVLRDDPRHAEALRNLGVLDLEAGLFESAISRFETALDRDPDDAMCWYFLGSAAFVMGDMERTKNSGYRVIHFLPDASLGYDLVGCALLRQHRTGEAEAMFRQACLYNPRDTQARNHLEAARHARGESLVEADDPTDLTLLAIQALGNEARKADLVRHLEQYTGEIEFELLEAGVALMNLGLIDEASQTLAILLDPRFKKSRSSLPFYYLAFLAHQLGKDESEKEYLKQAAAMSSDYVFPSRVECIPVLQFAFAANPGDAHAHLLLGNLLGGLGRMDEAKEQWEQAVRLDGGLSVAHRNLGLLAWQQAHDLDTAEKHYRRALKARPDDQALVRDLANILLQNQQRPKAITLIESKKQRRIRTDLIEILAQAYVDEKAYAKAIDLLSASYFSNWENRTMSRSVYVRAHLERGKERLEKKRNRLSLEDFEAALEYPEFLGVGRPANPEEAEGYYWKGKALAALNRTEEARAAWQQGAEGRRGSRNQNEYVRQCKEML